MRLLLASNASYDPPKGGSTRSNLAWLRPMAARGHEIRAVCPTDGGAAGRETVVDGISIRGVKDLSFHHQILAEEIRRFQPDWVLVSSEDLSHVLLREAAQAAPGRLIYLAHTPQFYPFGPESWNPDSAATELVRQARAVIAIGTHMAGYIREHAGCAAHVIHPPMYGTPPYRQFGRFGSGFVLMINPCLVKGLPIFLDLARAFPDIEFAALNGWGTTTADREAIGRVPNARLLRNVPDIEEVLAEARLLLMPSLWYEGFGLIAMEAMLRGLPVISSDSGGLMEAKSGTGYIIPVRPITKYEREFDETHMPVAVAPPQNLEPWKAALQTLLTAEPAYRAEAERSREAALRFVAGLDAADFERMLEGLGAPPEWQPLPDTSAGSEAEARRRKLDAARRELLRRKLSQRI
ncbi:MAG: glycosyltransferase family 4 protein [Bryobacteraceae bacterium]|nr:glycosyltransferase family 4 protein [Bryobacteraceae bacterium]